MSRTLHAILASSLATLVAIGAGCKPSGPAESKRPPAPVVAVKAVAQDVPIYLDEIGRCTAYEMVSLQPQVSGKIVGIHFVDGAEITKGKELFTIDARPFSTEQTRAEGMLLKAQANVEMTQKDFQRVEGLEHTDALSKLEFDTKKNALAVAQAEAKASQASLDKAKLDVEYCTIRSPIDGRAGQRLVDVGNVVKVNEANLLTIQRLSPIYVDFTTTERNLALVRRHMAAEGNLKVLVQVPNDPAGPIEGELTFLDNAVVAAAGTVKLRATLKNEPRRLWAGQYVQVRLVLETKSNAVLVPSRAVQISQTGPFVYVVTPASTAELRPVTVGQQQDEQVVIETGVAAGEQVVVAGQMLIMPGGPVTVTAAPAAGAPPATPTTGPSTAPTTAPSTQPVQALPVTRVFNPCVEAFADENRESATQERSVFFSRQRASVAALGLGLELGEWVEAAHSQHGLKTRVTMMPLAPSPAAQSDSAQHGLKTRVTGALHSQGLESRVSDRRDA